MSELILHHYPQSPFSEKIRRVLAFKQVAWRSVQQPIMLPKPDLIALTGGYRRLPVLQVGADLYCDTSLIARVLDRLVPEPACIPPEQRGLIEAIEEWADQRVLLGKVMAPVVLAMLPDLPPDILEDRAKMSPGMTLENLRRIAPQGRAQTLLALDRIERMLAGRAFVLGDRFTLADAACFDPIWFLRSDPELFGEAMRRPALADWYDRIAAFGDGDMQPMPAPKALDIARAATPSMQPSPDGGMVTVTAADYGAEPTTGRLLRLTADDVSLLRDDPLLGPVAVHFPRSGYRIQQQQA